MTVYDIGDAVTLRAEFENLSGAPADPTDVTLKVKSPSGTVTTYAMGQVTREGVGVFTHAVQATESGRWSYRWSGTGAVQAAEEATFYVRRSAF